MAREPLTQEEYRVELARFEKLMGARPGTPEGEELNMLIPLLVEYEEQHGEP